VASPSAQTSSLLLDGFFSQVFLELGQVLLAAFDGAVFFDHFVA
jgi:hypothetical protein